MQHFKKIHFSIILLFLWVIFVHLRVDPRQHSDAHPDPNPAVKNNADPCGSGSTTMVYTILWRSSLHIYIYLLVTCALLLWRPKAINLWMTLAKNPPILWDLKYASCFRWINQLYSNLLSYLYNTYTYWMQLLKELKIRVEQRLNMFCLFYFCQKI